MPARLDIKTRGFKRASDMLENVATKGKDVRPAWVHVMEDIRAETADRFNTEGRNVGWPKVAASTLERDARGKRDPAVMRVTGALQKSLTAERARGGLRRRTMSQMRFGTTLFYADFHQRGRGTPKRVLLEMDADMQNRAAKNIELYIVDKPPRKPRKPKPPA